MGLGDEIMALGRAETIFEQTQRPVAICSDIQRPRFHDCWVGNPAWNPQSSVKILDGNGCRPYTKYWLHRKAVFNLDYRARAGKIYLRPEDFKLVPDCGEYAVISPHVKRDGSPNKDWGAERWEKVIENFPIPVYQCLFDKTSPIKGAIGIRTPNYRQAAAIISKSRMVMTNEGGAHHMAASFGVPAVVIFGSFIPPSVTGYDFHENIAVETEHGFCGNFDRCEDCQKALTSITPELVRHHCNVILNREKPWKT